MTAKSDERVLNALAPYADMEQWTKANDRKQFAAYRCYQLLNEHLNNWNDLPNTSEEWEDDAKEWTREWQDAHNDTLAALVANRPPQKGGE